MKNLLYILEHINHNDLIKELSYLDVVVDKIEKDRLDSVLEKGQEYWTIFDKSASVFTVDVIGDIISSFGAYRIKPINNKQFKIITTNPRVVIAIVAMAYQYDYELNDKNSHEALAFIYNKLANSDKIDVKRLKKEEPEWWK